MAGTMTAFSFVQKFKPLGLLTLLSCSTVVSAAAVCVTNTAYTDAAGYVYSLACGSDTTTAAFTTQDFATGDFTSCFAVCDANALCQGFTWSPNTSGGGTCLLKKSPNLTSGGPRKVAAILVSRPSTPISTSSIGSPANVISSVSSAVQVVVNSAAAVANTVSAFTCANDDGQIRTDAAGTNYRIGCSSDTLGALYATHSVTNGFNDCFAFCDNSVAIDGQVCTAFTFQSDSHVADGTGSGTCSMKNRANQDFTPANSAHVAAIVTVQAASPPSGSTPDNAAASISTATQGQDTVLVSSPTSSVLEARGTSTTSTTVTATSANGPNSYTVSTSTQLNGPTQSVLEASSTQITTSTSGTNILGASGSEAAISSRSISLMLSSTGSPETPTLPSSNQDQASLVTTASAVQTSVLSSLELENSAPSLTSSSFQIESAVLISASSGSPTPPPPAGTCQSGPVTNSDGVTYTIYCDAHTVTGPYISHEEVPSGTYIHCSLACDNLGATCGAFEWIPDGLGGGICYYKSPGQEVSPAEPGDVVGIRAVVTNPVFSTVSSESQEPTASSATEFVASPSISEPTNSVAVPPESVSTSAVLLTANNIEPSSSTNDVGTIVSTIASGPSGPVAPGNSASTSPGSPVNGASASVLNPTESTTNAVSANAAASSGTQATSGPNIGESSNSVEPAPANNPVVTSPTSAAPVSNNVLPTSSLANSVSTNNAIVGNPTSSFATFSAPPQSTFIISSNGAVTDGLTVSLISFASTYTVTSQTSPAGPPPTIAVIPVASIVDVSSNPPASSSLSACPSTSDTSSSGSTDCVDDYGNPFDVTYGTVYQGRIAVRVGRPNVGSCLRLCDEYDGCSAVNFVNGECQVLTDVTGSTGSSTGGEVGARRPRDHSTRIHVPPTTYNGGATAGGAGGHTHGRTRTREHPGATEPADTYPGNHLDHSRTRTRSHTHFLGPGPVSISVGGIIGHSHTRTRTRTRGGGGGGEPGMDHSHTRSRTRTGTHTGAAGYPSESEAGGEPGMGHSRTRTRTRTRNHGGKGASSTAGEIGPSASGYPSRGVLCPNYNGQQYTDRQGEAYRIHCEAAYFGTIIFSSDSTSDALYKRQPDQFTARSCLAYCDQVEECVGINFSCDNVCTLFGDLKHLITTDQCGLGAKKISGSTSPGGNGGGGGYGGGGNVITISVCPAPTKTRTRTVKSPVSTVTVEPSEMPGYGGAGAGPEKATHTKHVQTKSHGPGQYESSTRAGRTKTKTHTAVEHHSQTRKAHTKTKTHTPVEYQSKTHGAQTGTRTHTPTQHQPKPYKEHTKTKGHTKGGRPKATAKKPAKAKTHAAGKHPHQKATPTANRQPGGIYQLKAAKKKKPVFKHFFGHLGP